MPKWRRNSIFGPGPRKVMDREARAQFKAKLHLNRRPGRLTIAAANVGRILCDMLGPTGRLDPCHATIAAKAAVCVETVRRALAQLRVFGFLDWTRRLIRAAWRTEQTSSAYVLTVPTTASFDAITLNLSKPTPLAKCASQHSAALRDIQAMPDLLRARREELTRRALAVAKARLVERQGPEVVG
jgi:hypothetical protein